MQLNLLALPRHQNNLCIQKKGDLPVRVTIRALVVAAITAATLLVVPSVSFAKDFVCPYSEAETKHCYAESEWNEPNLGVQSNIRTFFASVPEPETDFVDNEMWDFWGPPPNAKDGWVEAGDKAGYGEGRGKNVGFDFFTAVEYPPGASIQGYYEADFNYGPAADEWFEDTLHAAGSGVWYIYIAGSHVWSWGSLPGSANWATDGMEATNNNIVADGQSMNLAYWSTLEGARYEGWFGDYPVTYGHTCITLTGDVAESFANEPLC